MIMLNDFQSTVEEKKKRKLTLLPTTDDAFTGDSWNITAPIKKQAPMTPGDPNNEAFYSGSNPLRNINSRPDRVGQGTRVVERNMLPSVSTESPKINETPNAQRDSELGAMTAAKNGNTTTYDIGGNTLSFEGNKNTQTITNLEKINPNGIQRVGNMDVSFDSSVSPEARKRFLENPVAPTGQMAQYEKYMNTPRGQNFGVTKIANSPPPPMGWRERKDMNLQILDNQQSRENNLANLEEQRQRAVIDKDKNRIDEMGVIAENKLRDIQGQVAKHPPIKETTLKPMVIEEADPNDPTGTAKRQKIMIPNAEGTGYVDGMSGQPTFSTPKPATTEKLLKMRASKDPNFAAAEAEYKMRFGNLPY